tara:strand:- start:1501 stop:2676 length:1176 start_codon:yes stop_codon:yes gene_type:complete
MATTFKTFMNNDVATTRTLLHEAIPITGTIASGTYSDNNIKTYAHGMFQSVYDYPFLSSSANHIFDITVGLAASSSIGVDGTVNGAGVGSVISEAAFSAAAQYTKKRNIYDQMAQVLMPYDISGNIRAFDQDGNLNDTGNGHTAANRKFYEAIFVNFSRLLTKDEIKKGGFSMTFLSGGTTSVRTDTLTLADHGASSSFLVNSPTGEYGLLYTASTDIGTAANPAMGHIYYQAGIAVISPFAFYGPSERKNFTPHSPKATGYSDVQAPSWGIPGVTTTIGSALSQSSIDTFANGLRNRLVNVQFNNTTELNSTIYFCRANTGDYNYSSNPTYLTASKIRVKGNNPFAQPVSYFTTVGLYSPNNELLAVAKVSEPLKKTPSNELTLRVRLDY